MPNITRDNDIETSTRFNLNTRMDSPKLHRELIVPPIRNYTFFSSGIIRPTNISSAMCNLYMNRNNMSTRTNPKKTTVNTPSNPPRTSVLMELTDRGECTNNDIAASGILHNRILFFFV